jgi:hypothetical protein
MEQHDKDNNILPDLSRLFCKRTLLYKWLFLPARKIKKPRCGEPYLIYPRAMSY